MLFFKRPCSSISRSRLRGVCETPAIRTPEAHILTPVALASAKFHDSPDVRKRAFSCPGRWSDVWTGLAQAGTGCDPTYVLKMWFRLASGSVPLFFVVGMLMPEAFFFRGFLLSLLANLSLPQSRKNMLQDVVGIDDHTFPIVFDLHVRELR